MSTDVRRWTLTEIEPSLPPHAMGPRVGHPGQSVTVVAVDDVRAVIDERRRGRPKGFKTDYDVGYDDGYLRALADVAARLGLEDDKERTGSDGD